MSHEAKSEGYCPVCGPGYRLGQNGCKHTGEVAESAQEQLTRLLGSVSFDEAVEAFCRRYPQAVVVVGQSLYVHYSPSAIEYTHNNPTQVSAHPGRT